MRPGSGERPVADPHAAGTTSSQPVAASGGEDLVSGEPSRVLLAGDVHGFTSQIEYLARIATRERCEVILQLGDFGYWPHQEDGLRFLHKTDRLLASAGVELLFLDGNHENFDRLLALGHPAYGFAPVTERIRYIPRGTRWQWQGVTFLGLGGAHSIDKEERLRYERKCSRSNWLWWPQETITDEEAELAAGGGRVDVLVCHDCPWNVALAPHCGPEYMDELATELNRRRLQRVVNHTEPLSVFHAHYHVRHSSLYFSHTLGRTVPVEGLNIQDTGDESWRVLDLAAFRAAHPERLGG